MNHLGYEVNETVTVSVLQFETKSGYQSKNLDWIEKVSVIVSTKKLIIVEELNPIQHRVGQYGPTKYIFTYLTPLRSKLSTYTQGPF